MKVTALALDFQMCLCRATGHLTTAPTPLLAGAQPALLAPEGCLTRPKEARVFDRTTAAVGKKHLQANVDADRRAVVIRMRQITGNRQLTHNQRVPVTIGSLDQVTRLRRALYLAVALDLDRRTEFTRDTQDATIQPHILAFGELAQLNAMPL